MKQELLTEVLPMLLLIWAVAIGMRHEPKLMGMMYDLLYSDWIDEAERGMEE